MNTPGSAEMGIISPPDTPASPGPCSDSPYLISVVNRSLLLPSANQPRQAGQGPRAPGHWTGWGQQAGPGGVVVAVQGRPRLTGAAAARAGRSHRPCRPLLQDFTPAAEDPTGELAGVVVVDEQDLDEAEGHADASRRWASEGSADRHSCTKFLSKCRKVKGPGATTELQIRRLPSSFSSPGRPSSDPALASASSGLGRRQVKLTR